MKGSPLLRKKGTSLGTRSTEIVSAANNAACAPQEMKRAASADRSDGRKNVIQEASQKEGANNFGERIPLVFANIFAKETTASLRA